MCVCECGSVCVIISVWMWNYLSVYILWLKSLKGKDFGKYGFQEF